MKNALVKRAVSLLLSSSILAGGGISVLADEQTPDDSGSVEVEEDLVSEDALYGTSSGVALNEKNFPDTTFRNYLKQVNFDKDEDGYLSESEIDNIRILNLYGMSIFSLKGVEYLTNLCDLDIEETAVYSLDLSANPGLKTAYTTGNENELGDPVYGIEYLCYNKSWLYAYRSLTITPITEVTFSSGLGWNRGSKGWWFKNADGSYPKDGLKELGGFLYYFDEEGYCITNTWKEIDGEWYRFGSDGAALFDWQKINGKWYSFNISYQMRHDYYLVIYIPAFAGEELKYEVYYLDSDGAMATGWQYIRGEWRYFNSSGVMQTDWVNVSGKWYYFEKGKKEENVKMITGWKQIDGTWYYFKSSGAMAEKEYCDGYWLNPGGAWTYQHKASWKKDSTGWWFGDSTGWYAKDETLTINGKSYNFNSAGYCTNP